MVACIDGQSARKHYAAIIERNYLEIQPNITLLLPLSERDKIGNRNTTNRKPNFFFSPFPSYDVLRSWFTSQSDYRLHYFTLIEISLTMSYKTIQ